MLITKTLPPQIYYFRNNEADTGFLKFKDYLINKIGAQKAIDGYPASETNGVQSDVVERGKKFFNPGKNGAGKEKQHVLYIEDNEELRVLVSYYLNKDYRIDAVSSGDEALKQVEYNHYDIIITDINLGVGIDGIDTVKYIREKNSYHNVPVIAATAYSNSDIKSACREVGMDAFIVKPFMKKDLLETIESVMAYSGSNRSF